MIVNIFPIPVSITQIERPFTETELDAVQYFSKDVIKTLGNYTSKDSYVLNSGKFDSIIGFITKSLSQYITDTINPKSGVDFYITQSWVNYTKPGQYHHRHTHPNSIISGVLYFNAIKNLDKITFFKETKHQISIGTKGHNQYNCGTWWIPAETGTLILFPSNLEHMVEHTESEEERISLAFNVFVKGNIGGREELSELRI